MLGHGFKAVFSPPALEGANLEAVADGQRLFTSIRVTQDVPGGRLAKLPIAAHRRGKPVRVLR